MNFPPAVVLRPEGSDIIFPVTVDAGHFQVETSFLAYGRDRSGGVRSEWWSFAETNLKYGINSDMDLQLVLSPWVSERMKAGGVTEVDLRKPGIPENQGKPEEQRIPEKQQKQGNTREIR